MSNATLPDLPAQLSKAAIRSQAIRTIYRAPFTLGLGSLGALLGAYLLVVQPSVGALWYLVLGLFAVAMAYVNRAQSIAEANRSEIEVAKAQRFEAERTRRQYEDDLRDERYEQDRAIVRDRPNSMEALAIRDRWDAEQDARREAVNTARRERIAAYEAFHPAFLPPMPCAMNCGNQARYGLDGYVDNDFCSDACAVTYDTQKSIDKAAGRRVQQ